MNRLAPVCQVCVVAMLLACIAAPARRAHADFDGAFSSNSQYSLKFSHMPDFDQKRGPSPGIVGFPNDGNMYCVPCSSMNLFAYAANHGFPNVLPGPAWWQSQQRYNESGSRILALGALMFTHPVNGTNSGNAQFGASIWLSGSLLTCSTQYASGDWSPTITHIAQAAASGGIVAFGYGRYDYIDEIGGTHFVGMRTGGHAVTLAEAIRSGNQIVIKVRDPGDDPDINTEVFWLYSQSPFTNKVYNTVQQIDVLNVTNFTQRFSTSLIMPPPLNGNGDPVIRLIDSFKVVQPMWGLTWQPGINNDPPKIKIKMPQFVGSFINSDVLLELVGLMNMSDMAIGIEPAAAFVVGETSPGVTPVKKVNIITGEMDDIITLNRAEDITFGRKGELYTLSNAELNCINVDDRESPIEATAVPPNPCVAMCYDDARDEVILLCPSRHKIFRYPHRFAAGAEPQVQCIPENIEMAGDGSVHVNPVDGKIWFITDGTSVIYHVPDDPACEPEVEMISFGEIVNPRSLTFDDIGQMYVKCDAGLKKLVYNDRLARWEIVADDYFADFEVGPKFFVTRSRTNYDPAIHDGPEWNNVIPDEEQNLPGTMLEVDCLADFVSSLTFQPPPDGVVDAADLAFLLGEWGECPE